MRSVLVVVAALFAGASGCAAEVPPPEPPAPPPVEIAVAAPEPPPPAPASLQVAAAPRVSYRCAGGSLFVAEDRPYCVAARSATFAEAKAWCDDNGGALLTIESEHQSAALQRTFASPQGLADRLWIGLVEVRQGDWRWSANNKSVRVTQWSPGEPNNLGEEHCGEMYPGPGTWNDLACPTALPFLCEARGRRGAPGKLACTGRTFAVGTTAYCQETGRPLPWNDAETACKQMGGTLASFETQADIDAFRAATASPLRSDRAWLGLTDEAREGRFVDAAGRSPDFTRWRAGEPNDAGGGENCAEWYPNDAGWNDIPCSQPHVGICVPP